MIVFSPSITCCFSWCDSIPAAVRESISTSEPWTSHSVTCAMNARGPGLQPSAGGSSTANRRWHFSASLGRGLSRASAQTRSSPKPTPASATHPRQRGAAGRGERRSPSRYGTCAAPVGSAGLDVSRRPARRTLGSSSRCQKSDSWELSVPSPAPRLYSTQGGFWGGCFTFPFCPSD